MSLISTEFLLFVLIAAVVYYLIPKKYQWIGLLVFSYIYYISSGIKILFFLLYTTLTTYGAALLLERVSKREISKVEKKKQKRQVLILALLLNFGMLAVVKYTNFAIGNINSLLHLDLSFQSFILPLGISFYTFQSMGYIMDVYWEKCNAEKNPFRFALFVSFFPQILQGPIGRFSNLASQLYAGHKFELTRIQHAIQLILWGYFKKLVIADRAAVVVNEVFQNYNNYRGMTIVIAVLCYSAQLYGDFSGGIDVVRGVAGIFDIQLEQNFKRPYFAVSITDFWHRWHITLGTWMKDYVFYPLSLSGWMGRFGKICKKIFGKKTGRLIPICLANIIVFLLVGVWHGAAWNFIVYGLYNGVLIAASSLLGPVYRKGFQICRINADSKGWHIFRVLRTFLLVNISWYFDIAPSLHASFVLLRNTFKDFTFRTLTDGTLYSLGLERNRFDYWILLVGCLVIFVISFLQEQGVCIRKTIAEKPLVIRWTLYFALVFALPILGFISITEGGFLYAQF